MSITVRSPNPAFSGARCGVEFREGVATCGALSVRAEAWFTARGYVIERPAPPPKPKKAPAKRK